jgi:hypothetical protein
MDLDMRPPPMKRNLLAYEIQECPRCHCCVPRIDDLPERVDAAWIQDAGYQSVACDAETPEIPRRLLAYAYLARRADDERGFVWASLSAAWGFDDLGLPWKEHAAACRTAAIEAIQGLHAGGESFTDDRQTDQILCLDLLRRARRFDEANVAATEVATSVSTEILRRIALFQAKRAQANDDCRHTVEDVMP